MPLYTYISVSGDPGFITGVTRTSQRDLPGCRPIPIEDPDEIRMLRGDTKRLLWRAGRVVPKPVGKVHVSGRLVADGQSTVAIWGEAEGYSTVTIRVSDGQDYATHQSSAADPMVFSTERTSTVLVTIEDLLIFSTPAKIEPVDPFLEEP